jgi:hypothetical protein
MLASITLMSFMVGAIVLELAASCNRLKVRREQLTIP